MTSEKLITLLKNPVNISEELLPELRELAVRYPYFSCVHMLIAKIAHETGDVSSDFYTQKAALYISDRRLLYNFLNPEPHNGGVYKTERENKFSGNYFDLLEKVESEGGDTKQSLKSLAQRLKAARESIHGAPQKELKAVNESAVVQNEIANLPEKHIYIPMPDYFQVDQLNDENEISEVYAKKLIRERKYDEAIVILNKLNLINPKKSIYFADQIRFLEKILVNTKK